MDKRRPKVAIGIGAAAALFLLAFAVAFLLPSSPAALRGGGGWHWSMTTAEDRALFRSARNVIEFRVGYAREMQGFWILKRERQLRIYPKSGELPTMGAWNLPKRRTSRTRRGKSYRPSGASPTRCGSTSSCR